MSTPDSGFKKPTFIERLFNSTMGGLVGLGVGPSHMRVLEVKGRKSGKVYSLPVDLLERPDGLFLVAPRGRAQWVRNAEAQGEVVLRRGKNSQAYGLRALGDEEKPEILKAYLDSFRSEVQGFFPVKADSPLDAFKGLVGQYPAFELTRKSP